MSKEVPKSKIGKEFVNRNVVLPGGYEVLQQITEGAAGTVFLVKNPDAARGKDLAAAKVVDLSSTSNRPLEKEAKLQNMLQPHKNIMPIFDSKRTTFELEEGQPVDYEFIVMKVADGSLHDRLQQSIPLPLEEGFEYMKETCDAMQHAHDNGVVHGDLKPGNLLIDEGEIKVTDFGSAYTVKEGETDMTSELDLKTNQHLARLSPSYAAPEQFIGPPKKASDQFALGVITTLMFIGALPFDRKNIEKKTYEDLLVEPQSWESILGDKMTPTLQALEPVVAKALSPHEEDRYESVAAYWEALKNAYQSVTREQHTPGEIFDAYQHHLDSKLGQVVTTKGELTKQSNTDPAIMSKLNSVYFDEANILSGMGRRIDAADARKKWVCCNLYWRE